MKLSFFIDNNNFLVGENLFYKEGRILNIIQDVKWFYENEL